MKRSISPAHLISEYMTRLYENGMTTTSGGNLSVVDDNGSLWISPSGVDKAHLTPEDIMEVRADGRIVGKHKPSTEYPFHLAVRRARPELKALLHAHPSGLVALSLARRLPETRLYTGVKELCGELAVATYALPGSELLGSYVSDRFAEGYNVVILENHGVCIGAPTMEEAYRIFEALEYSALTQISAAALGKEPKALTDSELSLAKATDEFAEGELPYEGEAEALARALTVEMAQRCYKNKLFSAANGVYASRVSEDSFVITPEGCDVMLLEDSDLSKVSCGRRQTGSSPSRYAKLIERIFASHKDINSVAISKATDVMAFAVTDAEFDSHLIPEGYICLRNVSRYPFGSVNERTEEVALGMTMRTPIAIIEKDCVIVAGTSPLNAYDRLEVMEFGARSLRSLASLGLPVIRISEKDIRDIEVAFGLE